METGPWRRHPRVWVGRRGGAPNVQRQVHHVARAAPRGRAPAAARATWREPPHSAAPTGGGGSPRPPQGGRVEDRKRPARGGPHRTGAVACRRWRRGGVGVVDCAGRGVPMVRQHGLQTPRRSGRQQYRRISRAAEGGHAPASDWAGTRLRASGLSGTLGPDVTPGSMPNHCT